MGGGQGDHSVRCWAVTTSTTPTPYATSTIRTPRNSTRPPPMLAPLVPAAEDSGGAGGEEVGEQERSGSRDPLLRDRTVDAQLHQPDGGGQDDHETCNRDNSLKSVIESDPPNVVVKGGAVVRLGEVADRPPGKWRARQGDRQRERRVRAPESRAVLRPRHEACGLAEFRVNRVKPPPVAWGDHSGRAARARRWSGGQRFGAIR